MDSPCGAERIGMIPQRVRQTVPEKETGEGSDTLAGLPP